MKRHFSNRGEALAEATAMQGLARRKTSVKAAFMTQAARRTKSQPWPSESQERATTAKSNALRPSDRPSEISGKPAG